MFFIYKLKKILPESLFSRFLIIIITPTILAQIIAIYIFYQRHWSNVNSYMVENVSNEIQLLTDLYKNQNDQAIINKIGKTLNLKNHIEYRNFKKTKAISNYEISALYERLTEKIDLPLNIDYTEEKNTIEIQIDLKKYVLFIYISKRKIDTPTTEIFILWMTGTATILTLLAILFLRNQVKFISNLANVAEKFGKGIKIENFKPSGALEIKKAGLAFLKMKERIERQINQRTFMLAAVSHDLKTPITRIKLELEMFEQNAQIADLKNDICDMERMIAHYLEFARGEEGEMPVRTDIRDLISNVIKTYRNNIVTIDFKRSENISFILKPEAFKRMIFNIIDNALRYADKIIIINLYSENNFIYIEINDDGPGISDIEKQSVLKPFYRINSARDNVMSGSVGLGLAIAKDIANSHGGNISLEDNHPRGLKLIIKLPS